MLTIVSIGGRPQDHTLDMVAAVMDVKGSVGEITVAVVVLLAPLSPEKLMPDRRVRGW
jgi:hypothetical protein